MKRRIVFLAALACVIGMAWRFAPTSASPDLQSPISTSRIVGYYAEWDKYCTQCVPLAKVQFQDLTALNYAFADPTNDGCKLADIAADAHRDFPILKAARRANPDLQVILSIAAPTADQFAEAVSNRTDIDLLVKHCMHLIRKAHPGVFTGFDIDWEYPSNHVDESHFSALVREFRKVLGPTAPLTAAVTPYFSINWKVVTPLLSWINLMAYDFHGPWDSVTDFLAPLNADPSDPEYSPSNSAAADAQTMIVKNGVPSNKIVLGIPFYGRGYAGVPASGNGLYQSFTGSFGGGTFPYYDLVANYIGRHGFVEHGPDPYSTEVWLYRSVNGGDFINFDDQKTMAAKVDYIRSMNLGGAMIWELGLDTTDSNSSLLTALSQAFGARWAGRHSAAAGRMSARGLGS